MNRDTMIKELTNLELSMLSDNPELSEIMIDFFTEGGYTRYDDRALENIYNLLLVETE